jgi:CelD/BcsL family acetyltransferase involved in cellulose biosynthesis
METQFKVEIASTWDVVATRWERLQAQGILTPFQQAHWQSTWYRVFGQSPDIEPMLVTVSDRRCGRDTLLLPLVRRRVGLLRVIEFADLWVTDYNAPLIGRDAPYTRADAEALWNELQRALPEADLVRLTKMPLVAGGRNNPLAMIDGSRRSEFTGYVVHLPDDWDEYHQSLKKDFRGLLRRRWRRFTESGNAHLRWIEDPGEGLRVLSALQSQQTTRLATLGARHVFDDPRYLAFYERHVVDGMVNGSAVLTALVAEGEIVATFLGVVHGTHCTLIRSSQLVDRRWSPLGLGKLIIERSMHALHERGIRVFDLSIGDFAYKHDFQVVPVPLFDLDVARTWRATTQLYRDRTWTLLKKNPQIAKFARSVKRILSSQASSA